MKLVDDNTLKALCENIKSLLTGITDSFEDSIIYNRRITVSYDDIVQTVNKCYFDEDGKKIDASDNTYDPTGLLYKARYDRFCWRSAEYNNSWEMIWLCDGIDSDGNLINPLRWTSDMNDTGDIMLTQSMSYNNRKYVFIGAAMAGIYEGYYLVDMQIGSHHIDNANITGWGAYYYIQQLKGMDALKAIAEDDAGLRYRLQGLKDADSRDFWLNGDVGEIMKILYPDYIAYFRCFHTDYVLARHIPYFDFTDLSCIAEAGVNSSGFRCAINAVTAVVPKASSYNQCFFNCEQLQKVTGVVAPGAVNFEKMFCFDMSLKEITDAAEWDMSSVTNTSQMFVNCDSLDFSFIKHWDLSNVVRANGMFSSCHNKTSLDLSNVDMTSCQYPCGWGSNFFSDSYFTEIKLPKFSSSLKNINEMFTDCIYLTNIEGITNLDLTNVTELYYVFSDCRSLTELDLAGWDTHTIQNWAGIFSKMSSMISFDLTPLDTSAATTMNSMFSECTALTNIDLSTFDTSKVTDMSHMFYYCQSLTELDISMLDLSSVTKIEGMFRACYNLKTLYVGEWDMKNIEYRKYNNLFWGTSTLTTITGTLTNIKIPLYMGWSPLDSASAQMILSGLYDFTNNPDSVDTTVYKDHTVQFSKTTYALLSEDDIKTGTDKGWTITQS